MNLICVGCGNVQQGEQQPFAAQGHLCLPCFRIASNRPGGVRHDDPYGSRAGAIKVFGRTGNQRATLFAAFAQADPTPLTDYDAAGLCDMLKGTTCYWKRCGELRDRGVLAFTGEMRMTSGSDVPRGLSAVTPLGRRLWWEWQS